MLAAFENAKLPTSSLPTESGSAKCLGNSLPALAWNNYLGNSAGADCNLGPAKTYTLRGTPRTYAIKTRAVTDNWTINKGPRKGNRGPVIREEKGTQTQTFWSRYFRVGRGPSTWMGGGQKVRYVLRSPGKPNFFAGYPVILPGYPGGVRKVWEKKVCVQFSFPTLIFRSLVFRQKPRPPAPNKNPRKKSKTAENTRNTKEFP